MKRNLWVVVTLLFFCGFLTSCKEGVNTGGTATGAVFPLVVEEGWIVFISNRHSLKGDIYLMSDTSPNDANALRLTNNDFTETNPAFSPDGTQILFTSDASGNQDCWRLHLDDGTLENLTPDTPSNEDWCRFSPDGAMFTFNSDRAGNPDVWMYFLEGRQGPTAGDPLNLTADNPGFDGESSCRPDPADNNEMRVIFTSIRNGSSVKEIHQFTFNDETFAIGAPTLLTSEAAAAFPNANKMEGDIAPDLSYVVYALEKSAAEVEIHRVALNSVGDQLGARSEALTDENWRVRCAVGRQPNYAKDSATIFFENVGDPIRIDFSSTLGQSGYFFLSLHDNYDPFVFKAEPF